VSELRRGRDEASLLMALNTTGCAGQFAFPLTLSYEKERGVVTVLRPEDTKRRPAAAAHAREVSSNTTRRTEPSA
jgi:hypothetical protein